jgi:heme exporter protein A
MNQVQPLPARTLTLDSLAGRRGERTLFAGLSLTLNPGQIVELRGPNGAGKSTLLLIIAGIVHPAAGGFAIGGGDPEESSETAIGFLGHRAAVKARLSVTENLRFWAALNGRPTAAVLPALETVGLGPIATLDAGHLSAGQTRRLALARLLLLDRPLWLLDEPTAALDAQGEALVATLIDAHLGRGGLVLAATHHDLGLRHKAETIVLGQPQVAGQADTTAGALSPP